MYERETHTYTYTDRQEKERENYLFLSFECFSFGELVFFLLICKHSLYIKDIKLQPVLYVASVFPGLLIIFSLSLWCFGHLLAILGGSVSLSSWHLNLELCVEKPEGEHLLSVVFNVPHATSSAAYSFL